MYMKSAGKTAEVINFQLYVMETAKIGFPEDLNVIPEEPVMAAGELVQLWEFDAMFEAMIGEEEMKRGTGMPEWVLRLF